MRAQDFVVHVSAASELPERWTDDTIVEATIVYAPTGAQRAVRCTAADLMKLRRGVITRYLRTELAGITR